VFAKWNSLVDEVVGVTKNDWTQEKVCCNLFKVPSRNNNGAARSPVSIFHTLLFIHFKRNNHIVGRQNRKVLGFWDNRLSKGSLLYRFTPKV
jgi:hypothetical protein